MDSYNETKYKELKKKYAILMKEQQYQMIQQEYEKVNSDLAESIQEKRILQNRINEILGKQSEDN
ncbi:unnamed protein product (macronuclear) [Paramecium tetraurelia]|uniref:Uncharacterized protein n=1 Tax=Paramecium tetraurelia TaxID=5888 RepID=A0DSI3_PARTE|nr:uncharacterized protein GSPATT00019704001 [Paramecium tetraurelia]CAK86000.1 unnamed protein product [Paramecium tetraurelia]|eukprot:XP_001453397.1 hypothetical protein (macronuclear) [Paramecium tetraurelia strain d4-2]